MAEEKKLNGSVTFLNRGKRHYVLGGHSVADSRRHAPGTTMVYTSEEAVRMEGYKDLVDISKLPGQVDTGKLKSDNAKLLGENEQLKARLEALESNKSEDDKPESRKSRSKGE